MIRPSIASAPWNDMVALLSVITEPPEKNRRQEADALIARYRTWRRPSSEVTRERRVKILERASTLTALVDWSDAQGGRYAQQCWRFATAKVKGICAICGDPIYPGEAIYRPTASPLPANADAMISASLVNRLPMEIM